MKIEQNPKFQPITITLETKDEAEIFWAMMNYNIEHTLFKEREVLAKKVSDWFTTEAHL